LIYKESKEKSGFLIYYNLPGRLEYFRKFSFLLPVYGLKSCFSFVLCPINVNTAFFCFVILCFMVLNTFICLGNQMQTIVMKAKRLELQSERNRKRLMEVVFKAKAAHIGGDLSCLNVLTVLYFDVMNVNPANPKDPMRDRFIMSKGHCVEALYVTLESRGFIPEDLTNTLGEFGSILSGHPTIKVPGIEVNTGALGHGLSIGTGIALAGKMNKLNYKTFVLMGDGEQGEGSIYEAAMAAKHYMLDNLVAIIDRNGLQISGATEDIMAIEDIRQRWTASGWDVKDVDGDNIEQIIHAFGAIDYSNHRPHLLISHTTKGKGVSYMEGVHSWHHGIPCTQQYEQAIREISERIENLGK
jgi:transketolase